MGRNSSMKYTTYKIEEIELDIDFQKLYDYISKEDDTDDIYFISNDFGDNFYYYMENALGIVMDSGFVGKIPRELDNFNTDLENKICDDFYEWIKKNK